MLSCCAGLLLVGAGSYDIYLLHASLCQMHAKQPVCANLERVCGHACRVGKYKDAATVNKRAYDFDVARSSQCIAPYLPEHNINVLVYAAR